MTEFTAHKLFFAGSALTPILFGEHQGSAIRGALFQHLLERLFSLWEEYGGQALPIDFADLMARAAAVRLVSDETTWLTLRGYSTRQGAPKQLNGFVGRATYEGDLDPLLPSLVWGEQIHVGKDAIKGCGLYRVETAGNETEAQDCSRLL